MKFRIIKESHGNGYTVAGKHFDDYEKAMQYSRETLYDPEVTKSDEWPEPEKAKTGEPHMTTKESVNKMSRYKSIYKEYSRTVLEYGTFAKYKKEVLNKIKFIFDKLKDNSHVDSGLLGRNKPRIKMVGWQLIRLLQDMSTKFYNDMNIEFRLNPKNTVRVVFKKVDDAFYTFVMLPNYYLHINTMDETLKEIVDACKETDLEHYDGSTRIKVTPQIDYAQLSDPNMEEELKEMGQIKENKQKHKKRRFSEWEDDYTDTIDSLTNTYKDPNEFVQMAKKAGVDDFDIGHTLVASYSLDNNEAERLLSM